MTLTSLQALSLAVEKAPDEGVKVLTAGHPRHTAQEDYLAHIDGGGWPSWPLALRGRGKYLGLRMRPGTTLHNWSLVDGKDHNAWTLATHGPSAMPMRLYDALLRHKPSKWEALEERWPRYLAGVAGVHEQLGGGPALDVVDALFWDHAFRVSQRLDRHSDEGLDAQRAYLERVDTHPAHLAARRFAHNAMRFAEVGQPPDQVGPWREFCAAVAFSTLRDIDLEAQPPSIVSHAWALLLGAVGFDTDVGRKHRDHMLSCTGIAAPHTTARAMATITKCATGAQLDAFAETPLWEVLHARARKDPDWDIAYMKAAEGYDAAGDGESAWNMLCSGAFWSRHLRGTALRPFFDAARGLARAYAWNDVTDALDDMAQRAGI